MAFEIVQVVQEFSTSGGVETVAYELAVAWDRAGIPNLVLASGLADGARTDRVRLIAPWLANIPTRGPLRHLGRLVVMPVFELLATLAIRAHRDSVILSHGNSFAGDALVIHAVNAASLQEKRRAGNWKWRLNPMHLWVAARDRLMIGGLRYRRYVAVSPAAATDIETFYRVPKRLIAVIPNGIDLDKFKPDASRRASIRREFNVPDDARVLLFVGHEFDRKGLAHAIGALEHLDRNVRLVVVGADDRAPYQHYAAVKDGRVVFAGERRDAPAFYAAADALVLPTAYETFSLVCMEAMATGIPVFATRVGGIEDYLEDGVNGYGIARDSADIAAKVGPVLSDASQLAALGAGARATATRYAWDGVAARYATLLQDIWNEKMAERHSISDASAKQPQGRAL